MAYSFEAREFTHRGTTTTQFPLLRFRSTNWLSIMFSPMKLGVTSHFFGHESRD